MTTEEKAQRYDKAFTKSREFLELCKKCGAKDTIDFLEDIFPELKENEDGKMWKLIKKYAHSNISDMALNADHITRKQLESWIEKQCEQNPTWSEEDERIYYSLLADIRTRQDNSTNTLKIYYNEQIDWLKSIKDRMK
jgi:hypothetical protein